MEPTGGTWIGERGSSYLAIVNTILGYLESFLTPFNDFIPNIRLVLLSKQTSSRDHTVVEALAALEESLAVFPGATSADLIFGRPGQGVEDWLGELAALCDLGLPHLSMYQLTVERGTRLWGQVKGGQVQLPEEEQVEDMYLRGVELLKSRGLLR